MGVLDLVPRTAYKRLQNWARLAHPALGAAARLTRAERERLSDSNSRRAETKENALGVECGHGDPLPFF